MQAKSRWSARRVHLRPLFAIVLAAATIPATSASAAQVSEWPAGASGFHPDTLIFLGPPKVTLDQPPTPSSDSAPSFSGTASETTLVTIYVYAGDHAKGTLVATLKAQVSGNHWVSAQVNPPLADGTYTAIARQVSSVDFLEGVSEPVTFEIDTQPPTVTLRPPPSPSNDAAPSFSGTASEATEVTVEVFEGPKPEGRIVATARAAPISGSWTSGAAAPALGDGTFTAIATQPSAIGNPPGWSAPVKFVVDTKPPTVTLDTPPSPSNEVTPAFSGTASEATEVTVEVFAGPKPEGLIVATAHAPGGSGSWTSGAAAPALSDGTFTAIATQPSEIGNLPGFSAPVTFVIDTKQPAVTLDPIPSPSGNAAPAFSGTASDHEPVTVQIYEGAHAEGAVLASATAEVQGGRWASGRASPTLQWGEYTAVATQPSSIGNPSGSSAPLSFVVAAIPPAVTTEGASSVARTSAAMYGSVNPRGAGINACYFEYGPTFAYGHSVECGFLAELRAWPPSGTNTVPVFARIYGLSPATTYHFRLVGAGEGGTGVGADDSFTTMPPFSFGEEGQGGKGVAHAKASSISRRRLAALITVQLRRHARRAHIASLLRSGAFKARFTAPEAGTAAISWSYQATAREAKQGVKNTGASTLVAVGKRRFSRAGRAMLELHLTRAGARLLTSLRGASASQPTGASSLRLRATCAFTPPAARPVRRSVALALRW
ncbi:MAG: hypothetical protein E6G34_10600 [Actinobacteria bacterium]|nr:MAG: hypothetical protein E6G34_10600 [Actinomycetota bacterium]